MKKIRFGIVGCGAIAHTHALAISNMEGAELVAVASRTRDKDRGFAGKYACDFYTDFKKMLQRPDIDIINICTPSGLHADMAITAAGAGKHVIVEKPMDITLEKADEMIKIFEDKKLKLCVVFQRRYEKDMLTAKRIIDEGRLGEIFYGGCYVKWFRSQEYYDSAAWRGTWELDGGGVLMNQSIHYIDLLQYFLGPVQEVYARCGTFNHEIEVEDLAVANLRFASGALGIIEATTNAYPGLMSRIDIYGSNGTMVIENDILTRLYMKGGEKLLGEAKKEGTSANSPLVPFVTHKKQFEQMIKAIQTGTKPEVDGNQGRKSLEIIIAMYKSSFLGKPVKLPISDSLFLKEYTKCKFQD